MISVPFAFKLVSAPLIAIKATLEYYTIGTVYSRTSDEFKDSVWKNVLISVEHHFVGGFTQGDLRMFVNKLLPKIFELYRRKKIVTHRKLENYGEFFTDKSQWLVGTGRTEPNDDDEVLVLLHGGGYAVSMTDQHFVGMLVLYHSLPRDIQDRLSILIVDYSLTTEGARYPTQIHETLEIYSKLCSHGYKNISLIGDSAGGNLALSLARFIAYPEEGKAHYQLFSNLIFDFNGLVQPKLLILCSPWLDPLIPMNLSPPRLADIRGDLCPKKNILGEWYAGGLDAEETTGWLGFGNTSYDQHWKKVDAIREEGRTLVIVGTREFLKEWIQRWMLMINLRGKMVRCVLEKGGIHDCIFMVETLDYMIPWGFQKALDGQVDNKFCLSHVRDHLVEVLSTKQM